MNLPRYRLLCAILLVCLSTPALAQPVHGHEDGMHNFGLRIGHGMGDENQRHKGNSFSPNWTETLSENQKVGIDRMHLEVSKVEKLLRAKVKTATMELKLLAVQERANLDAINKKIKEIVDLKAEIMSNRYKHIVEMRKALTQQQRISYDMGVLNHMKKGDRGH